HLSCSHHHTLTLHDALPILAATSKIPIVFITGGDPIKFGFVRSLNRPGGNVTGVNIFIAEMEGKRLGLLRDKNVHPGHVAARPVDRKSTRLNSSHVANSYAV